MSRLCVTCSLVAIITVLIGLSVGTAQAAIVSELTGTFAGLPSFTADLCSGTGGNPGAGFPTGADITGIGTWSISHSQTSVDYSFSPPEDCFSTFSGTTDGPITGSFESLSFTGNSTGGGGYSASSSFHGRSFPPIYTMKGVFDDVPFTGFWSNGWYSTGFLFGNWHVSGGGNFGEAVLAITTVTAPVPEPSTFMMLGAGLLPVIGVIRRSYLNRQ